MRRRGELQCCSWYSNLAAIILTLVFTILLWVFGARSNVLPLGHQSLSLFGVTLQQGTCALPRPPIGRFLGASASWVKREHPFLLTVGFFVVLLASPDSANRMATSTKLCVFCRHVVPISHVCSTTPSYGVPEAATPLHPHEAAMFLDLQSKPSSLCQRCAHYDIARVFVDAMPLDRLQKMERNDAESHHQYFEEMRPYELPLGLLSSLVLLTPSCPLCRLIFRILPREGLDPEDDSARIVPFRSYTQQVGWQKLVDELRPTGSILLGVDFIGNSVAMSGSSRVGSESSMMQSEMHGESIALATKCTSSGRKAGNAAYISQLADLSFAKLALEDCIKNHGNFCQPSCPPELRYTRMVDVHDRKVVPYPDGCRYVALSYCWGGVMPEPGALEAGALPRTIEDAITITKELGMQYIWVDALCIDQSPNPTPEQEKEKMRQLKMMDLIYSSAGLTVIAMAGANSNVGLPGISADRPRDIQIRERIGDLEFFTVPPTVNAERLVAIWATRAWTLQEEFLSRRQLSFTGSQMEFQCYRRKIPEALDMQTLDGWPSPLPEILDMIVPGAHQVRPRASTVIPPSTHMGTGRGWVASATSRRRRASLVRRLLVDIERIHEAQDDE